MKNTQLVEVYDQAQVDVAAKQHAADAARLAAVRSQAQYEKSRQQLTQTIAAQYEGGSFSAAGALLSSSDGQSYLDQLNTESLMTTHTAQTLAGLSVAKQAATTAEQHAASLLASAKIKRDAMAKHKASVQQQVDKYTTLLATLNSAQRAAFQRSRNPSVPVSDVALPHGMSPKARSAVQFALKQVGKPYVFGASGPDAYDCSGLTMASWQAGGVSLPHSAQDQYNYGTHVALDKLEPGDLIFFYQPIGHVTIYIGDGEMVSAPEEGENVSVVALTSFSGDVTGATRLP